MMFITSSTPEVQEALDTILGAIHTGDQGAPDGLTWTASEAVALRKALNVFIDEVDESLGIMTNMTAVGT